MGSAKQLSDRRKRLLQQIARLSREHGVAPTVRELASSLGESVSTTHKDLRVLRDLNLVTWREYMPRTLRVVKTTQRTSVR